jgi:hypothetical protein
MLKVTVRRDDDAAEVKSDGDRTTVSIKSPFGISRAVVERRGDAWPKEVVLRLHLKGLERFEAGNGKVTLRAVAGIRDGKPDVRLWKDDAEERPLAKTDALWTEVRIVGADGKPATKVPVEGGYFEVPLPRGLFEGNPKSVTVSWIDFYRG